MMFRESLGKGSQCYKRAVSTSRREIEEWSVIVSGGAADERRYRSYGINHERLANFLLAKTWAMIYILRPTPLKKIALISSAS